MQRDELVVYEPEECAIFTKGTAKTLRVGRAAALVSKLNFSRLRAFAV